MLNISNKKKFSKGLYTNPGIVSKEKRSYTWFKYSGWSVEGIKEFNTIFDNVAGDRIQNASFEVTFMKKQIERAKNSWHEKLDSYLENDGENEEIVPKTSW